MFIKVREVKNKKYISIVKSYREAGKVKHKELLSLGAVDKLLKNNELESITKKLIEIQNWEMYNLEDIGEVEERYCYGSMVYKKLWEEFEYDKLMKETERKRKKRFDLNRVIFLQVISRLLKPGSRLTLWKEQGRYLNNEEVHLHDIYRSLDIMSEEKEKIETYTFDKYRNIFNLKVDVVFYDCTTFHFESIRADSLKDFGYSKSGNFNEVQVVMGLLIDKEGHPIGFNLFPGNTSENNTFIEALETLKRRFLIDKIIFVADRGLNSKNNIYLLQQNGYKYIVSSRLRSAKEEIKKEIFSEDGYKKVSRVDEEEKYKYKVIENVSHRIKMKDGTYRSFENRMIITWSEKRRNYDEAERLRMVEKAKENFEKNKSIQYKRGWKKYLELNSDLKPVGIDFEKIEEDSKWDGYYAMETNILPDELKEEAIIDNLHNLWKIEETYRIYKTTLEAEPVFVWTPKRITGHFVICFMALVLERTLESMLKSKNINVSPEKIRNSINYMELYKLHIKGKEYYLRSKLDDIAEEILKTLKIKQPPVLSSPENINIF